MGSNEDLLMRLVIKGMDPADVRRLAETTWGELKNQAAVKINEIAALHLKLKQQTEEIEKDKVEAQIKQQNRLLQNIQQVMRQQEIEVNKAVASWDRWLERMENITTVLEGVHHVVSEGMDRLKELSEEVIRTTQIYNSLTGSIDEMRDATEGEVADIDLIAAKNRGLEKDLKFTDQQFGIAAAAAKKYADSIGVDTKEALDKLIDGLATGRVKMLEHAGIMGKWEDAQLRMAESVGKTVKELTDEEKLLAIQGEALKVMTEKTNEAADAGDKLANRMERGWARLRNIITGTMAAIGNIDLSILTDPTSGLSNEQYKSLPRVKAAQAAQDAAFRAKMQAKFEEENAGFDDGGDDTGLAGGGIARNDIEKEAIAKMKTGSKRDDEARKAAEAHMRRTLQIIEGWAKGIADWDKEQADLAKKAQEEAKKLEDAVDKEDLEQERKANELAKKAADLQVKMEEEHKKALGDTAHKAGFMGYFLWGEAGPDQTYEEMDAFAQGMVDVMGSTSQMLEQAGKRTADAIGKSLAATVAGSKGNKASLRQMEHDVLESLSGQAFAQSIFEGAMALKDLAMGNFPGAAAHGAAAAAFAGVATTLGLGARAIGSPAASAGAGGPSSQHSSGISQSGPSFGSQGVSSAATGSRDAPVQTIVINMNGVTTSSEAGAELVKMIAAHENVQGPVYAKAA